MFRIIILIFLFISPLTVFSKDIVFFGKSGEVRDDYVETLENMNIFEGDHVYLKNGKSYKFIPYLGDGNSTSILEIQDPPY